MQSIKTLNPQNLPWFFTAVRTVCDSSELCFSSFSLQLVFWVEFKASKMAADW
jgi:hypothetical protein